MFRISRLFSLLLFFILGLGLDSGLGLGVASEAFAAIPPSSQSHSDQFHVVIDPGHGGNDEGAIYQNGQYRIAEKDVTLKVARKVAETLRARHYWVTLTRDSDREVLLPARTALANRLGADIFISIHMNSTHAPKFSISSQRLKVEAEGIETYILNNTSAASSKRLAHLENSVISQDFTNSPAQYDVALILKDLRLDANLSQSKRLACAVQSKLVSATSSISRGVKQALFHVLLGADMPSILVEAGFLNNQRDRDLVLSDNGLSLIGNAITTAIMAYRKQTVAMNCKIR